MNDIVIGKGANLGSFPLSGHRYLLKPLSRLRERGGGEGVRRDVGDR